MTFLLGAGMGLVGSQGNLSNLPRFDFVILFQLIVLVALRNLEAKGRSVI